MKWIKDTLDKIRKQPLKKSILIGAIGLNISLGFGGVLYQFLSSALQYYVTIIVFVILLGIYRKNYGQNTK